MGGSVTFDATGSYDPQGGAIVSYEWDLDGDGEFDDAQGIAPWIGWDTLAVRIFEMTSEGEWARASLPALTLVLVGLLPVVLLIRRSARRPG